MLDQFIQKFLKKLDSLMKARCILCGEIVQHDISLCQFCEAELPLLSNYCQRCAEPLPRGQSKCGPCLARTEQLNTRVLFYYAPPLDELIMGLKFGQKLIHANVLGYLLAKHLGGYLEKDRPEVIIPVPLHSARLGERGFNQALEIAKPLAKKIGIPLDRFSIRRVKNTFAQAQLKARERPANVYRAFAITPSFTPRHIALVDDVITTGSTIFELARTCFSHGVERVDVYCCAKRSPRVCP